MRVRILTVGCIVALATACLANQSFSLAQEPTDNALSGNVSIEVPTTPLTLPEALRLALKNYPSIQVARAKAFATKEGVTLAKTAYLPSLDLIGQVNQATRNSISGLLLPQTTIPTITGPVLRSTQYGMAWGSAAGALFSWEPIDFGLRKANVGVAKSELAKASANTTLTEFELTSQVAQTFLKILTSQEAVRTAEAYVNRSRIFVENVGNLTRHGFRPVADLSRAEAELSQARVQLIQAKENQDLGLATLAQLLGVADQNIQIQEDTLFQVPPTLVLPRPPLESHPALVLQRANIEVVQAREKSLSKSYFPKFNSQGSVYGRGSGIESDGVLRGGLNGLYPSRANVAVGFNTTFRVFDIASIRAQQRIEQNNERAEQAQYEELIQELTGKQRQARVMLESALAVAQETPIQLKAAKDGEAQLRARYQAGLVNVVDVADAERVLAQSEIQDAVARLGVWQAILSQAVAQGNLAPFLKLVSEGEK